jgi:hypothetical protein
MSVVANHLEESIARQKARTLNREKRLKFLHRSLSRLLRLHEIQSCQLTAGAGLIAPFCLVKVPVQGVPSSGST